jgi:hypothetical protein
MAHEPHTHMLSVPGVREAPVKIVIGVCPVGECKVDEVIPNWKDRWAACGITAEDVPGVHWWEDTLEYHTLFHMAMLHRAEHEQNLFSVTFHKERLAYMARTGRID